jgi:hypothetical protein
VPIRPLQLYADGGYQLRIRRLEGTPNYGPRQIVSTEVQKYQHKFTSSDISIQHKFCSLNNKLIEVGGWTGVALGWANHEGCWMPPQIGPAQRRDCMCYTRCITNI